MSLLSVASCAGREISEEEGEHCLVPSSSVLRIMGCWLGQLWLNT